ncbi:excisionase family DNA-binding protein [Actinoplanes sp. CA-030573]|uniref:excisionase family DNA-binding protein n=1 Tax=Actinoplanes sp. CA-030573 TaxID=3239898 RepID=UPI003D8F63E5
MAAVAMSPVSPDEESIAVAAEALPRVQEYLRTHPSGPAVVRVVDDGEGDELVVPRGAVELLARVLAHMANGHGVSVVPEHAELTTQQAAALLNVSRPYLIGLLEAGVIEFRKVGTHRRVLAGSVLTYKHRDDMRRRAAADELAQLAQDMDLS